MAAICYWSIIKISPNPIEKMRSGMPRAARQPTYSVNSVNLVLKHNKTVNPFISGIFTFLTSHILILADSSHLPSDEAYRQRLSLPCNRLLTPCYECKPNARNFFDKIFIKAWFCWRKMCLFCHMTSKGWLEIMIQHTPSIICDFHFPVDGSIFFSLISFDSCIRIEWG